jgi:ABC-2 type transport system ATP-binding protein
MTHEKSRTSNHKDNPLVETKGLTKRFGSRITAVADLNLTVGRGEVYGFLGPNGSGKSTTLRMLLGLIRPTSGQVRVMGKKPGDPASLRKIGTLIESPAFYPYLSGRDNLQALASYAGVPPVRVQEVLEQVKLTRRAKDKVKKYSMGMKQRLGVAAALLKEPELLILDEPTEGLDPLMQRAFYDILDDLRKEGRTIFFSSHVLSEVERVCDRVAIVRKGKLVALEDIEALLARRKRRVELRVHGDAPPLEGVPGISGIVRRDGFLTCALEGDVAPFLRAIAGADVRDLTIEPAHLEEAFLEYYAEDELVGLARAAAERR